MDYSERIDGFGTICAFETTIKLVKRWDLSGAARKLVDYKNYEDRVRGDLRGAYFPASPEVWPERTQWLRDGDEWYVVPNCDPGAWAAWRFTEQPPPPPGFDDDDDL